MWGAEISLTHQRSIRTARPHPLIDGFNHAIGESKSSCGLFFPSLCLCCIFILAVQGPCIKSNLVQLVTKCGSRDLGLEHLSTYQEQVSGDIA